jgi:hypothetical protein
MGVTMKSNRKEAAKAGRVTYVGGKCKRCKGTRRYTRNATCVACAKKAAAKHRRELMELGQ